MSGSCDKPPWRRVRVGDISDTAQPPLSSRDHQGAARARFEAELQAAAEAAAEELQRERRRSAVVRARALGGAEWAGQSGSLHPQSSPAHTHTQRGGGHREIEITAIDMPHPPSHPMMTTTVPRPMHGGPPLPLCVTCVTCVRCGCCGCMQDKEAAVGATVRAAERELRAALGHAEEQQATELVSGSSSSADTHPPHVDTHYPRGGSTCPKPLSLSLCLSLCLVSARSTRAGWGCVDQPATQPPRSAAESEAACAVGGARMMMMAGIYVPAPCPPFVGPAVRAHYFMIRTEDDMDRNVGESQPLLRFLS
eukprot:COSAG01_NODE_4948_length_4597_cov_3.418853_5_plen_309_part_00